MSNIFKHLISGVAQAGQYAAIGVAQKQMRAKHQREMRKGGGGGKDPSSCTPCAAKAKGAEMANAIWK